MPINNNKSLLFPSIFINCLKFFQEHPEQFPIDLCAKFCSCNNSKSSKKLTCQRSNDSNNNSKQLTRIAQQLKNMLEQKLKFQLISNDNQILLNHKRKYQDIDIIQTINYLIRHPEKIPIKLVNHLCKITANLIPSSSKLSSSKNSTIASHIYHTENNSKQFKKHNKLLNSSTSITISSSITSILSNHYSKKKISCTSRKRYHSSITSISTDHSYSKNLKRKQKFKRTNSRLSFKNRKKTLSKQTNTSSKINEQETFLQPVIQSSLTKEKLIKHQPIPFVIFRLYCPPGMIPLTEKVAEQLGIPINTTNQQIQNKLTDIMINKNTSSTINNMS